MENNFWLKIWFISNRLILILIFNFELSFKIIVYILFISFVCVKNDLDRERGRVYIICIRIWFCMISGMIFDLEILFMDR